MFIEARNDVNEVIFEGDADEFLEINDYDSELEDFLNGLDRKGVGAIGTFFGNQGEEFEIEHMEDKMEEEE